jgi:hypothetical protein
LRTPVPWVRRAFHQVRLLRYRPLTNSAATGRAGIRW